MPTAKSKEYSSEVIDQIKQVFVISTFLNEFPNLAHSENEFGYSTKQSEEFS